MGTCPEWGERAQSVARPTSSEYGTHKTGCPGKRSLCLILVITALAALTVGSYGVVVAATRGSPVEHVSSRQAVLQLWVSRL